MSSTIGPAPTGDTQSKNKKTSLLLLLAVLAVAALALFLVFRPGKGDMSGDRSAGPANAAATDPSLGVTPTNRVAEVDPNAPATKPTDQPGIAPATTPTPAKDPALLAVPGLAPDTAAPNTAERTPGVMPGHNIDTSGAIRLNDPMKMKISRRNAQLLRHYELEKTSMRVEQCSDAQGAPTSTKVLKSSGAGPVDAEIVKKLQSWRYLPSLVNGQPASSCTAVNVHFEIED